MANLSGRTKWQRRITLLLMLVCACSVARTQIPTAEQRLLRSMKSGNQAEVRAALRELAQKAPADSAISVAEPDIVTESNCHDDWERHCPKIVTVDYPGATLTILVAINDEGVIIGYYVDGDGTVRSFLRDPDGTYIAVDPPGAGVGPGFGTIIWSINDAGAVTGTFIDQSGAVHAYLRTSEGKYTQIDIEGAGPLCCTLGLNINAEDTVAGEYIDSSLVDHGYVRRRNGTVHTFSQPGAGGTGCSSRACGTVLATIDALDSEGDIAGWYVDNANALHGLLRFRHGVIDLFDVVGAGTGSGQGTNPTGINDRLEIPGTYIDENNVNHGFVRFANAWIEKFDVSGAGTAAGQGTLAENINRNGDIAGYYLDATGISRGFLRYWDGHITTFGIPNSAGLYVNYNNTANAIVGYYYDANNNLHGFLRTPETGIE